MRVPGVEPGRPKAADFKSATSTYSVILAKTLERGKRIELSALAWKAKVLPLYEPRKTFGALGGNRTPTQWIMSPLL